MKRLSPEEKETASHLKANLWLTVTKIVEEEIKTLDANGTVTASPKFIASLVELVYNQALSLGEDLESFANHGKRKTVQPDDLYMVTRRNDVLTTVLRDFASMANEIKDPTDAVTQGNKFAAQKASRGDKASSPNIEADEFDDDDELFAKV